MAGPTVKEILLKWGIDNNNWKKAIQDLARLLDQQAAKNAENQAKALKALENQKAKVVDLITARKSETAELNRQIGQLKVKGQAADVEKKQAAAVLATTKLNTAEFTRQAKAKQTTNAQELATQRLIIATQKALQSEVNTRLMKEKLTTAEIQKQSAAIRQQQQIARAAIKQAGGGKRGGGRGGEGGGGGGGFLGGMFSGLGKGLFGSAIMGQLTGAVTAGELLSETIEKVIDKIYEIAKEIGPLEQLTEQFKKLTAAAGIDPAGFISDLRKATLGLVKDVDLYRNANLFMQSGVKASEKDIKDLTEATVGLARAQGKDATEAVQALNRFFLTGQARTLAYATGVNVGNLATGEMTKSMGQATRAQIQFNQAQKAILETYQAIGQPALTYEDVIKRIGNSTERMIQQFVLGVTKSASFEEFLKKLGKFADKIDEIGTHAAALGEKFSVFFEIIGETAAQQFQMLESVGQTLWDIWEGMVGTLKDMLAMFGSSTTDEFASRLTTIKGIVTTLAEAFALVTAGIREMLAALAMASKITSPVKSIFHPFKQQEDTNKAIQEFLDRSAKIGQNASDSLDTFEGIRTGKGRKEDYKLNFAFPPSIGSEQQEIEAAKKIAKVKEEIALQSSKIQLEQTKMRIDKESELLQVQYDQGLINIKQYMAKKADIDREEHEANLLHLKQEFDAKAKYQAIELGEQEKMAKFQIAKADADAKLHTTQLEMQAAEFKMRLSQDTDKSPEEKKTVGADIDKQVAAYKKLIEFSQKANKDMAQAEVAETSAKKVLAYKEYLAQVEKEAFDFQKKGRARTEKEIADEIAARSKLADEILKIDQDRTEREKQKLEDEFSNGEVSAQEYLDKRVEFIEKEYQASVTAANEKFQINKDSMVALAELQQKSAEAAAKREKDLTTLTVQETHIRMKASEDAYKRAGSLLDTQYQYSVASSGGDPLANRGEQQQILEAQIELQKQKLQTEIKDLQLVKEGTAEWYAQEEKILQTKEALVKYNEELIVSKDYLTAIGKEVQGFAKAIGKLPKGGNTAQALGGFAQSLEDQAEINNRIKTRIAAREARKLGGEAKPVTPEQIFASLNKVAKETGTNLDSVSNHLKEASADVETWRADMEKLKGVLSTSIKDTTDQLVTSADKVTKAFNQVADAVSGTKSSSPQTSALGGATDAASPGGSATASDAAHAQAATIGSLPIKSASPEMQQLSVAMSLATQTTKKFASANKSFMDTFLGDDGLIGAFKHLGDGTSATSDDLKNFGDSLQGVIGNVGGLISAFQGKGGPLQAGLQGAQSGMAIGNMIPLPGAGLVGAAVGGVVGVVAGKARKAAEKISQEMVARFNAALQNLSSGTQTLGATVQLEINNINEAVSRLSGKKGGRDELKKILPQMEQQLQQLKDQQRQVIKSFDEQLDVLNAPNAYQPILTNVQGVIDKYTQYIQAGGSVANANKFLQDSFKNLARDGYNELNQDQQDAINNALNYNDLLMQRQDLIQSTNMEMQNIMSQGVAVRQLPQGVSKAIQIQKLMRGASEQMDKMNEEIAVSQHKLENEKAIFNLATTRVGLETQLVELQNTQTDQQTDQIKALQNFLGMLSSKGLPTSMQTAMQGLGLGSGYVSPGSEPALKPTPPVKTGVKDIDLQNELEYQQALMAYNQSLAPPGGFIPATGTVGTSPIPSSITNGGQKIDTTSTSAGTALLVAMAGGSTSKSSSTGSLTLGSSGAGPTSTLQPLTTKKGGAAQTIIDTYNAQVAAINNGTVDPTSGMAQLNKMGTSIILASWGSNPNLNSQINANMAIKPMKAWAAGGIVPEDGPGYLHKGEKVTPADQVKKEYAWGGSNHLRHVIARHGVEASINNLANARISSEATLIGMKMAEIQADMARIGAHNDLIRRYWATQGPGDKLENLMHSLYSNRSRQGFGGFYGEVSNPL